MKTPEEIKKGLEEATKVEYRRFSNGEMLKCIGTATESDTVPDALAYIQQLESRLAQAEMERDAAIKDLSDN